MSNATTRQTTTPNRLLAALASQEREHLSAFLETVPLEEEEVLYESGDPLPYAYFPTRGLISAVIVMESGATAEVGMIGREGMACVSTILGGEVAPFRAVVQCPGEALRLRAGDLAAAVLRTPRLRDVLAGYVDAFLALVAQSAACNGLHTVERRCCRWLLMAQDWAEAECLPITQELLSRMLGVRRASVAEVARALQRDGVIRYVRGRINVLDRAALAARSCECYRVVRARYDRLFGPPDDDPVQVTRTPC